MLISLVNCSFFLNMYNVVSIGTSIKSLFFNIIFFISDKKVNLVSLFKLIISGNVFSNFMYVFELYLYTFLYRFNSAI